MSISFLNVEYWQMRNFHYDGQVLLVTGSKQLTTTIVDGAASATA